MKIKYENGRYYLEPNSSTEEGEIARLTLRQLNVCVTVAPAQETNKALADMYRAGINPHGIGSAINPVLTPFQN